MEKKVDTEKYDTEKVLLYLRWCNFPLQSSLLPTDLHATVIARLTALVVPDTSPSSSQVLRESRQLSRTIVVAQSSLLAMLLIFARGVDVPASLLKLRLSKSPSSSPASKQSPAESLS